MGEFDYLIVGAGITGATLARVLGDHGKRCLVLERRDHVAGNCFDTEIDGIRVHRYGAHIFHTSNTRVWQFINRYTSFNHYINAPVANFRGETYNLPFNMNTFSKLWGVVTPEQAQAELERQRVHYDHPPRNLEEQALSIAGRDIYEKLIRGYTEKQWGRACSELPASIIKRIPFRFRYDNNYFNDPYQGIPEDGYTRLTERLLEGTEVQLKTDYLENQSRFDALAKTVIYTGAIDAFFQYTFGRLQYRTLRFEDERLAVPNYQGVAVMNYTDRETPYTRVIEHKHFLFGEQPCTVITREYPVEWEPGMEPYYPIEDEQNMKLLKEYQSLAQKQRNVRFCGRLAEYRYYDMDKAVAEALETAEALLAETGG